METWGRSIEQIRAPIIGELFVWKAIGFSPGDVSKWQWFIESRKGAEFAWVRLDNDGLSISVEPEFANMRLRTVIIFEKGGQIDNSSWPVIMDSANHDELNPRHQQALSTELESQAENTRKDLARIQNERGLIWKAQKIESKIARNEALLSQIQSEKDALWAAENIPKQLAELEARESNVRNRDAQLSEQKLRLRSQEQSLKDKELEFQFELQILKERLENDVRVRQEELSRQMDLVSFELEAAKQTRKQLLDDHDLQLKLAEVEALRREAVKLKEELEAELDNMLRGMSKVWSRMGDTAKGEVLKVLKREKLMQAEAKSMQIKAKKALDAGVEICGSCDGPITRCRCGD